MTDDGYDSKNKKKLPAYVRMYVRRKVFYKLSVISVICHQEKIRNSNRRNSKKQRKVSCVRAYVRVKFIKTTVTTVTTVTVTRKCMKNRCTRLMKQVHVFGSSGAPI